MSNTCQHGRYDKGYCADCEVNKLRAEVKLAHEALRQECRCKSYLYICPKCDVQSLGYECKTCIGKEERDSLRAENARLQTLVDVAVGALEHIQQIPELSCCKENFDTLIAHYEDLSREALARIEEMREGK